MNLSLRTALPPALLALPASALADALGGPTLFDLRKDGSPPLFIAVLLHGNETSGWEAVARLAPRLAQASVLLFVGNVEAARARRRCAPGGLDFNRVWEGGDTSEADVASRVVAMAAEAQPTLAVDVHNNTGRNPPYAVVCRTDAATLQAAAAFSPKALLATQPRGFLTRRFARFCTAVTIEAGTADDPASAGRAADYLGRCLAPGLPAGDASCLELFETEARVMLRGDAEIEPDTQRYNFQVAPAGTVLTRRGALFARNEAGCDVGGAYLEESGDGMALRRPTRLAMFTGDLSSARQDCLCYFLKAARQ